MHQPDRYEELNHQVEFMDKIYASCHSVLVWLGEVSYIWDNDRKFVRFNPLLRGLRDGGEVELEQVTDGALADMLSRNYWSRMWTAQDFVMPPSVRTCLGAGYVPLTGVLDILCVKNREYHGDDFSKYHRCEYHSRYQIPAHFATICKQRARYWNVKADEKSRSSMLSWENVFMSIAPTRRCTEPKDYVYAILGMCHLHSLIPNYNLTSHELLVQILLSIPLENPATTSLMMHRVLKVDTTALRAFCRSDANISAKQWLWPLRELKDPNTGKSYRKYPFRRSHSIYGIDVFMADNGVSSNGFLTTRFLTSSSITLDFETNRVVELQNTPAGLVLRRRPNRDLKQTPTWDVVAAGLLSDSARMPYFQRELAMQIHNTFADTTVIARRRKPSDPADLCDVELVSARVSMDVFALLCSWGEYYRFR